MFRALPSGLCVLLLAGLSAIGGPQPVPVARTDQFGDPLPAGALSRLGTIRWRHGSPVSFAAFLPEGKSVLTAAADGWITIWDYPIGKMLSRFDAFEKRAVYTASSRRGAWWRCRAMAKFWLSADGGAENSDP